MAPPRPIAGAAGAALSMVPIAAHAHGGGLVLLVVGLPWAALAWLVAAIWFVRAGERRQRAARLTASILVLPLWGWLFLGPWFSSWEPELRIYEEWWALGLPALLLVLVIGASRARR